MYHDGTWTTVEDPITRTHYGLKYDGQFVSVVDQDGVDVGGISIPFVMPENGRVLFGTYSPGETLDLRYVGEYVNAPTPGDLVIKRFTQSNAFGVAQYGAHNQHSHAMDPRMRWLSNSKRCRELTAFTTRGRRLTLTRSEPSLALLHM